MRPEQWELFKQVAKSGEADQIPVSLIIDSPWMPGYLGISFPDYYFDQEMWFNANRRIMEEFPDVIFFPSWWVEYGMAIEPSAMGCRIHFAQNQPPAQLPSLLRLEDIGEFQPVDPLADGLMCATLHRYHTQKNRIFDAGYTVPVVTARGPLCTASFVRGVSTFMMDLIDDPPGAHKLLNYITEATIRWLQAQANAIGNSVDGMFILDDIPGFLSRKHYLEFAHPYLKKIFETFPKDWVKVYHNDATIDPFLEDLPDAGFDVLNWTYKLEPGEVRRRTSGKIALMGNVPPLDIGVRGSPEDMKAATLDLLRKVESKGTILSLGGGVSPGMPGANIAAMAEAVREFNSR